MKPLHPLNLDFTDHRWYGKPWGLLVLGIGVVVCVLVWFVYLKTADDLASTKERKEILERKLSRLAAGQGASGATADALETVEAVWELRRPWDLLLQELEHAVDDTVALLRLDPDPRQGQVTITGESRQLADAVAFVRRLEKTKSLSRPTLMGHVSRQTDDGTVIEFSITASWRESR